MAMVLNSPDYVYDAIRLSTKSKQLDDQWDEFFNRVKAKNVSAEYYEFLKPALRKLEVNKKRKRGREINMNEEESREKSKRILEHDNSIRDVYKRRGPRKIPVRDEHFEQVDNHKVQSHRKSEEVVKEKNGNNEAKRKGSIIGTEDGPSRMKPSLRKENLYEGVERIGSIEKDKVERRRGLIERVKGKNMVRGENEGIDRALNFVGNQKPGLNNDRRGEKDGVRIKRKISKAVNRERRDKDVIRVNKEANGEAAIRVDGEQLDLNHGPILQSWKKFKKMDRTGEKSIRTKSPSFEAAEGSIFRKDLSGKRGKYKTGPEIEILDGAGFCKEGNLSAFVPSRLDKTGEDDNRCQSDFRRRVLDVLRKPYDKNEHDKHKEELQNGSYLKYYPDLAKQLKKHRYKRGKRLNILRGFLFWLQNLTLQGSFKPWKDKECVAIEPRPI